MIVVIGSVQASGTAGGIRPAGLAAAVAETAAAADARVEVVARLGDDPAGDAVLLRFAALGIGHVATLRDPARPTRILQPETEPVDPDASSDASDAASAGPTAEEPTLDAGDVGLALRYLTDFRVVVAIHPSDGVLAETVAAAAYGGAHLVVVRAGESPSPSDVALPTDALVLAAPLDGTALGDPLGRYAAAVDAGEDPAAAYAATFGVLEPAGL